MQVLKVYLVQVQNEEPFRLDLENVYSIDQSDRVLQKEEVLWLTDQRDPRLITLRIRYQNISQQAAFQLQDASLEQLYPLVS